MSFEGNKPKLMVESQSTDWLLRTWQRRNRDQEGSDWYQSIRAEIEGRGVDPEQPPNEDNETVPD